MTLEELSILAQYEFERIRREMVTKTELKATEINILRAIENLDHHLLTYASQWNGQFEQVDEQLEEFRSRLDLVDKSVCRSAMRPLNRSP